MKTNVSIDGKEITNPILKYSIAFIAIIVSLFFVFFILLVILPAAGVIAGVSISASALILLAAGLGILLYLTFKSVFSWIAGLISNK